MPRRKPKPVKTCPVCERPFEWRRKWADCWDEVKYCSERCRRHRNRGAGAVADGPPMRARS